MCKHDTMDRLLDFVWPPCVDIQEIRCLSSVTNTFTCFVWSHESIVKKSRKSGRYLKARRQARADDVNFKSLEDYFSNNFQTPARMSAIQNGIFISSIRVQIAVRWHFTWNVNVLFVKNLAGIAQRAHYPLALQGKRLRSAVFVSSNFTGEGKGLGVKEAKESCICLLDNIKNH